MKVLIVTSLFPTNEVDHNGTFILYSVLALIAKKHEVQVLLIKPWKLSVIKKILHQRFCVGKNKVFDGIELKEVFYFSIPRNYLRRASNFMFIRRIRPVIEKVSRKYNPDIIHSHSEICSIVAVKAAKNLGLPVVATLHGAETNRRYWKGVGRLVSESLNDLDRVIVVGHPLVDFFGKMTGRLDHFRIVYNGFRLPKKGIEKANKEWGEYLNLISVSNLSDEGKCIDVVLLALAKFFASGFEKWHYTIVGDGCKKQELLNLVNSLGLQNKVSFMGFCPHEKVYDYLLEADIFCLPSCREAFGIAHLEAMVCGLLTIGVRGQGVEAFIKHEDTGLLVDPECVDALVNLLYKVFLEKTRMQEIARRGKAFVFGKFSWEEHARNLINVYNELI